MNWTHTDSGRTARSTQRICRLQPRPRVDGDHLPLLGYQKWFDYEAQGLIPFFTHGPLIFWMYPVFGIQWSTYILGVSEWLFGGLILAGFWNKRLGALGALGSVLTFITTITIIPFMPDGWAPSAGGFPAMVGNEAVTKRSSADPRRTRLLLLTRS